MLFFPEAHYGYITHYQVQGVAANVVFRYCFQRIKKGGFTGTGAGHPGGDGIIEPDIAALNGKCNAKIIAAAVARCFVIGQVKCYERLFAGI